MDINAGDYLQKTIKNTYTTIDGEEKTEERIEYYFILDVAENEIEIIENKAKNAPYWSSPMSDKVVHDYKEAQKEYSIVIIPLDDMECEEVYVSYSHNGLESKRSIGRRLKWHGKELCVEYDDVYYNGRQFVHSPVGFLSDKKGA